MGWEGRRGGEGDGGGEVEDCMGGVGEVEACCGPHVLAVGGCASCWLSGCGLWARTRPPIFISHLTILWRAGEATHPGLSLPM